MIKIRFAAFAAMLLAMLMAFSGCAGTGSNSNHSSNRNGNNASADPAADIPSNTKAPEPDPTRPPAKENVAKVIIILGQSNAVGASLYVYLKDKMDADKYNFIRKEGYANVRIVYHAGESSATNYHAKKIDTISADSLFDKVKFGKSLTAAQFGLEVGIAEYLSTKYPDETFYIIKVARGGESLSPKFLEGGELFERAMEIAEGSFSVLKREGYTPEIMAICWMQGENEAGNKSLAGSYDKSLAKLAEALRRRLAEYAPYGGIPFIDGGISTYWTYYKELNAAKVRFSETSDLNYYIDSMSLGLTYDQEPPESPDLPHFDSESMWLLGQEFGKYVDIAYQKVK